MRRRAESKVRGACRAALPVEAVLARLIVVRLRKGRHGQVGALAHEGQLVQAVVRVQAIVLGQSRALLGVVLLPAARLVSVLRRLS